MEWREEAVVLSVRRHGESSAIAMALTESRGKAAGLVRHAQSKAMRGILMPGNRVAVSWRARLEDHLGTFSVEPVSSHTAALLMDPGRLAALGAACALVDVGLPEREPHPDLFHSLDALVIALDSPEWAETYVRWEVGLLAELGFGLDLSKCAVTGEVENLTYVSPKTGRAVTAETAAPYRDKLLTLPRFLTERGRSSLPKRDGDRDGENPDPEAIARGLRLTGYFLERHIFSMLDKPLPDARLRLYERFRKAAAA